MQAPGDGDMANHDQMGESSLVRKKVWVPVEGCGGLPDPTGTQRLNPCQKDGWLRKILAKRITWLRKNPCQKDYLAEKNPCQKDSLAE